MKSTLDIMTMALERQVFDEQARLRRKHADLERLLGRLERQLKSAIRRSEQVGKATGGYRRLLTRCEESLKNVRAAKARFEEKK